MNRRHFCIASLGAIGPLLAANRLSRDRISAITDEIARTQTQSIEFLKQYGLQWAELRGVPGVRRSYASLPPGEAKEAAKEFADNGVKVSFLNASLLKYWLPGTEPLNPKHKRPGNEKRFAQRIDNLKRAMECAHILGVGKVRVFAFSRTKDPMALMPRLTDILGEMVEVAGAGKIRLLMENEASQNIATCAETAEILRRIPSPWFGMNWDPLNGTRFKEPPMPDGYAKLPKERIGNVQIKGKSILPEYPEELLDWKKIFDVMTADGYKEQFGLETHIFGEGQIAASHACTKQILSILGS